MPPARRFDATLSLTAQHLAGTPHEGHPREAAAAVGEAVRALPGAAYVDSDYCGDLPGTWAALDRLELVDFPHHEAEALRVLRAAIEEAVTEALMRSPVRLPQSPEPVPIPAPILRAFDQWPEPPDRAERRVALQRWAAHQRKSGWRPTCDLD